MIKKIKKRWVIFIFIFLISIQLISSANLNFKTPLIINGSGTSFDEIQVRVDSFGRTHIMSCDSNKLVYYVKNNGVWTTTVISDYVSIPSIKSYCDFGIDSKGVVHFCVYSDDGQNIYYGNNSGGFWSAKDLSGLRIEDSCALDIDSKDNVGIVSQRDAGSTEYITYYLYNATNSSISSENAVTVTPTPINPDLDFDFDNSDNPHISYGIYGTAQDLYYANKTNGAWINKLVSSDYESGTNSNIVIDSNDSIYMVDSTGYSTSKYSIRFYNFSQGIWSYQNISLFDAYSLHSRIEVLKLTNTPVVLYRFKNNSIPYVTYAVYNGTSFVKYDFINSTNYLYPEVGLDTFKENSYIVYSNDTTIWYTTNNPINLASLYTKTFFTQDNPTVIFNISSYVDMSVCYWSPDNGTTNYTLTKVNDTYFSYINTTMIEGSYLNAVFYCNQTSDNLWQTSEPFSFEVDPINITQCRNLNVNRTYYLRNNITSSSCLNIKNNSITLIGNGFYINGTIPINVSFYDNVLFRDLNITGGSVFLSGTAINNTFLNSSLQSEIVLSNSQLIRKWFFNLQVNDTIGALQNAQVDIYNSTQSLVLSLLTDINGKISNKQLISYINLSGSTGYYYPYNMSISKSSYITNISTFNLTNNLDLFTLLTTSNAAPISILSYPSDNLWTSNTSYSFICNATDTNSNLQNITLFIWNSTGDIINQTNFSITGATNTTTFAGAKLSEGNNTWNCYVCDNESLCDWDNNRTISVDSVKPLIDYTANTEINYANFSRSNIFVEVSIIETNFKNITFYLYNSTQNFNTSQSYDYLDTNNNFTGLVDGDYYYNVTVYDLAENKNMTSSRKITLDKTPPTVNIVYPVEGYTFGITTIGINYTSIDNLIGLSSCWYTNDSGLHNYSVTCGENITQTLGAGSFTYTFYSNDSLNNIGSDSVSFSISLSNPVININYPDDNKWFNNQSNIYFNFTATDSENLSTCELWGNWTGIWHKNYTWYAPTSGNMNYTTVNITDGLYIWNIRCNDTLNFFSTALFNRTIGIDTLYPSLNDSGYIPTTVYKGTNVSVLANISDLNINTVWLMINFSDSYQNITITNKIGNQYYYNLSGTNVQNLENISWRWWVNDSANNQNVTVLKNFIVTNRVPYNVLSNLGNDTYINIDSYVLSFSAIDDDGDPLNYSIYNSTDGTTFTFSGSTTSTTYNLSGFNTSDGARNFYFINASDYNKNNVSQIYTFTIDKTAPTINSIDYPLPFPSIYCSKVNIPLNYSISETNIGFCLFNVTRTSTSQVSKSSTVLNSCQNTTFEVSLDGDFTQTIDLWVYDKANNSASELSLFYVNTAHSSCVGSSGGVVVVGGGGGGSSTTVIESNKTFCGDNICQKEGNTFGLKENFYNCPSDCKGGFNLDELIYSLTKYCFDKDDSTTCFWYSSTKEDNFNCGDGLCLSSENSFNCEQDCGNINFQTLFSNCIDGNNSTPCFWDSSLAAWTILILLAIIIIILLTKVKTKENKKIPLYSYVGYKLKKRR